MPSLPEVVAGRRRARAELLARAAAFTDSLSDGLDVRAVVVFGSVARGDFNDLSDIDVLVVADRLPPSPVARLRAVGSPRGGVEAIAWTPAEWRERRRRGDPIVEEALVDGVWLVGGADLRQATGIDVDGPVARSASGGRTSHR